MKLKLKLKTIINDLFKFPLYIITHPFKGFDEFKFEKKGKSYVAIIYVLLMMITLILQENVAGFLINPLSKGDINIFNTILIVAIPVLLAAVGNWSVTSLMDGKGKVKEILLVISYGLIPYIWFSIPLIFISRFLTLDEISFYATISTIGLAMSVYMMFMGLLVIHEYGLLKTILTVIITIVAIAVIIFIGILILTLVQQFYSFIESIYQEYIMRFI